MQILHQQNYREIPAISFAWELREQKIRMRRLVDCVCTLSLCEETLLLSCLEEDIGDVGRWEICFSDIIRVSIVAFQLKAMQCTVHGVGSN